MSAETLREQLHQFIETADNVQLGLLHSVMEEEKGHERYEWWNDPEMIARLTKTDTEIAAGTFKGIPWEDVKSELALLAKSVHRNNAA